MSNEKYLTLKTVEDAKELLTKVRMASDFAMEWLGGAHSLNSIENCAGSNSTL